MYAHDAIAHIHVCDICIRYFNMSRLYLNDRGVSPFAFFFCSKPREPHPQNQLNSSVPETPEYLRVATSTRARQAFHLVCRKLVSRA